jgi:glucose-6-phosphate 1-epimerase
LNAKFAIPTSVSFFDDECDETKSSSPYVSLTHKNGSTAKVYLFGANCASWTQPTGDEVLFVRPDAKFDESVPIAGESFVVSI